MIKSSRLPKNILHLLPKAEAYLKDRQDISFAYLFGSLAKGAPKPLTDVDIAVFFCSGINLVDKKMEILGDLMELLETDEIDLVILNNAPLYLKKRIVENRRIIADNDPFSRHKFESITLREYFDFSFKERNIFRRKYFHGR